MINNILNPTIIQITVSIFLFLFTFITLLIYIVANVKKSTYKRTFNMNYGIRAGSLFNISRILATIDLIAFIILPAIIYFTDLILCQFKLYTEPLKDLLLLNKTIVITTHYIKPLLGVFVCLYVFKLTTDVLITLTAKKMKLHIEEKVKNQDEDEFLLLKEKVLKNTKKVDTTTRLFFITAPECRALKNNLLGLNSELTEDGRETAKKILNNLDVKPDVIITSTMTRAKQTALFMSNECEIVNSKIFNECNLGDLEGLDKDKYTFYKEPDFPQNMFTKYHGDNFTTRAQGAIKEVEDIVYKNKEKKIFIITHNFLLSSMICLANDKIISNKNIIKNLAKDGSIIELNLEYFKKENVPFILNKDPKDEITK